MDARPRSAWRLDARVGVAAAGAAPRSPPAIPPLRSARPSARCARRGTSLVGDVTNTLAAYDLLADSELGGAVFRELIGFGADDPDRVVARAETELDVLRPLPWLRPSIVPHAPYSVSPALFRAIARASQRPPDQRAPRGIA